MKNPALVSLCVLAYGCSHSEFEVSPSDVAKKRALPGPAMGAGLDLKHLPPGAVKHEYTYKKGDRMPDGTISDGDRKIVTLDMNAAEPGGGKRRIVSEERTAGR